MDILCVNQRDKGARITAKEQFPAIFRGAALTIVVRDGGGPAAWPSDPEITEDIEKLDKYIMDNWVGLEERVLSRLWPLEEISLSDHIKFVPHENTPRRLTAEDPDPPNDDNLNWIMLYNNPLHFLEDLHILSRFWVDLSSETTNRHRLRLAFVKAFLNYGRVSRTPEETSTSSSQSSLFRSYFQNSRRRTTKPQDFILAAMPQMDSMKSRPRAEI